MEKKRDTTATLAVHRCRFVDYAPSAISALAFPPLPLPSLKGKSKATSQNISLSFGPLAVGHANGNIDLCQWMADQNDLQYSQAWVVKKTLPGPYPSKVDSLAFAIRYPDDLKANDVPTWLDLRLFSSGGGSELLEWDIERLSVKRTITSQGGSIWCIAVNPASTSLALGCEDGTIRLLSVENDTLTHLRKFDRVKCRMLSIAWGPPVPRRKGAKKSEKEADSDSSDDDEDDEDDWTDSWLVTGGSDSSLRKWDVATGRLIERMGTDKVRGERTLVWTVGVLGDGTIVSGDSMGMVKFWDSRTCTQLKSFRAHNADVLCMTISPEGNALYTSGVDQKIVQFSLIKTGSVGSSSWAQTASRRMHSHDVRALAIWPPFTPLPSAFRPVFAIDVPPILASGGLDMSVVVTPAALPGSTVVKAQNPLNTSAESTFEESYHRRLAYVAAEAICVSRGARIVACVRDAGVTMWRIKNRPISALREELELDSETEQPAGEGWEKILEMELSVNTTLIASAISDDGRWFVVSDLYETKLFSLQIDVEGEVKLKRIREFSSTLQSHLPTSPSSTGGLAFAFTPDSSKLVLSTSLSSYIIVVDLTGDKPRVLRRFDHHRLRDSTVRNRIIKGRKASDIDVDMEEADNAEEDDDETEEKRDASPLIANVHKFAISPDGQWLASTDELCRTHVFNLDSISHHSVLPSFAKPISTFGFDPAFPSVLIMAFPDNTVQIYDVESQQFPAWGKEFSASLPRRFTTAHEPVVGMTFDPCFSLNEPGSKQARYVLFWGSTWVFKVALETHARLYGRKRRREPASGVPEEEKEERPWRDYKMLTQYRPLLFVDFLGKNELVVLERPLVDVMATLPPAYFKHKYGAS